MVKVIKVSRPPPPALQPLILVIKSVKNLDYRVDCVFIFIAISINKRVLNQCWLLHYCYQFSHVYIVKTPIWGRKEWWYWYHIKSVREH